MASFPLFPQFPAEVRQQIWRCALAAQGWSVSQALPSAPRRLVGAVHRPVGQACREARAVLRATHVCVAGLGWVDMARHVVVVRDARAVEAEPEAEAEPRNGGLDGPALLARVRCLVLNPRDWPQLWRVLDALSARCAALRALVVVAPWPDPAAVVDAADPDDALHRAPYEDWRPLVPGRPAPASAQLRDLAAPLAADLDAPPATGAQRLERYRHLLDSALERLPADVDELDNAYARTRLALRKLDRAVAALPTPTARLYLRTRDELLAH